MAKKENNYYFDKFIEGMSCADKAIDALGNYFDNFDASIIKEKIDEIHSIEHSADGIKHVMMEQLVKEFLPPIEREDIVELSCAIDDVVDNIDDVLLRAYMYNITTLRDDAKEFVAIIKQSCVALLDMLGELHNFKKPAVLKEKIVEINHLEEEGDKLYAIAMHKLYAEEKDSVAVLAWSSLYDRFEKCCDSCEDVANTVEQILLKNS